MNFSKVLRINSLNVNCWSTANGVLRQRLIMENLSDIVCLTETHLHGDNEIVLTDFSYYGANRVTNQV